MPDPKPPAFDRSDRSRSLAALDLVTLGTSRTAASTQHVNAVGVHPQLGEIIQVPRQEIHALLSQFFVVLTFSRDMVEQLAALEKKTGVKADTLTLNRYAGVLIPLETTALEIVDDKLMGVFKVPSTLMPKELIDAKKEIAAAGVPTATGEIFNLGQLKAAKAEFDKERAKPN
jgi:hypothetical protein